MMPKFHSVHKQFIQWNDSYKTFKFNKEVTQPSIVCAKDMQSVFNMHRNDTYNYKDRR